MNKQAIFEWVEDWYDKNKYAAIADHTATTMLLDFLTGECPKCHGVGEILTHDLEGFVVVMDCPVCTAQEGEGKWETLDEVFPEFAQEGENVTKSDKVTNNKAILDGFKNELNKARIIDTPEGGGTLRWIPYASAVSAFEQFLTAQEGEELSWEALAEDDNWIDAFQLHSVRCLDKEVLLEIDFYKAVSYASRKVKGE